MMKIKHHLCELPVILDKLRLTDFTDEIQSTDLAEAIIAGSMALRAQTHIIDILNDMSEALTSGCRWDGDEVRQMLEDILIYEERENPDGSVDRAIHLLD